MMEKIKAHSKDSLDINNFKIMILNKVKFRKKDPGG